MINLYVGHDEREEVGTHVFLSSLLFHASAPVSVTHLTKRAVEKASGMSVPEGSNAFTMSRFLIPYLMNWRGWAIFMDGADMLMRADINELAQLFDPWKAVQVVKHDYQTRHPVKYVGTSMEAKNHDYPRKQWASVMLVNCAHYTWRKVTPSYVGQAVRMDLLQFRFMPDQYIGELPIEWNWLADEQGANPEAKVLHWTAGIPALPHYRNSPHADEWFEQLKRTNYATS